MVITILVGQFGEETKNNSILHGIILVGGKIWQV